MSESYQLMFIRTGYTEEGSHLPAVFSTRNSYLVSLINDYRPTEFPPSHFDVNKEIPAIKTADVVVMTWTTDEGVVSQYHYWIKSMEAVSISRKVTRVNVTPAYWLDYACNASISPARIEGKLKRSPSVADSIETSMMPSHWVVNKIDALKTGDKYGVLLAGTQSNGKIEYCYWEATWNAGAPCEVWNPAESQTVTCYQPNLKECLEGKVIDRFGSLISIKGIWIIPLMLFPIPTNVGGDSSRFFADFSERRIMFRMPEHLNFSRFYGAPGTFSMKTDDTHQAVILDPFGQIVARLPRQRAELEPDSYAAMYGYIDFNVTSPTFRLYMITEEDWYTSCVDGGGNYMVPTPGEVAEWCVQGKAVDIPAVPLPLTSNAYSDYLLSGEREYQQKMRETQALQGLSGVATGAVSGALIGAVGGAGVGAIPGALIGAGAGAVGLGSNYFGSKMAQEATEAKVKNQPSQVIQTGGGREMFGSGPRFWHLAELRWDPVSLAEYIGEVTRRGFECDRSVTDRALIPGGWQFENPMILNDDISTEVKRAMMAILERGIHLD